MTNPAARATWGKRTGVTSGLLGILCVLAELCFLLPDLLVTQDARPFYRANIDFFRALLLATIFATFALGAASILLLRSKTHGLLGIGLGCIALLMGGSQAQPIEVGGGAVSAGLDYLVLELLVLGLIFVPLERVFALRPQNIFRPGWQTDLKHFFVSHAGVQLISFASMVPAQALFSWSVKLDFQQAVAAQHVGRDGTDAVELVVDVVPEPVGQPELRHDEFLPGILVRRADGRAAVGGRNRRRQPLPARDAHRRGQHRRGIATA